MGLALTQVITEDRSSGAQVIDGSLKFEGNEELTFTPTSNGNTKTATWSFWVKRHQFGANDTILGFGPNNTNDAQIYFNTSDKLYIYFRKSSSTQLLYETTRVFRDTGWYHIVVSVDTMQASGQVKLYVNGEEVTAFGTSTDVTQYDDLIINDTAYENFIGRARANVSIDLNCSLSNVYMIDGQRLDASYFGFTDPLTNTWRPKKYTGNVNYVVAGQVDYESGFDGQSLDAGTSWLPFVGNTSNNGYSQSKSTTCTYTAPGSGIAYTSTIRLFCKNGSGGKNNITIDGTSFSPSTGSGNNTGAWNDISPYVTGNLLNTIVTSRGSSGRNTYWSAIEVDGVILTHIQQGVNGFYLPFDGNTPIGKDQSGNNNDWTPVNFGGSNSIEKATGALPILNTVNGGTTATAIVREDANASNLIFALPLAGDITEVTPRINNARTALSFTDSGSTDNIVRHFYGGSRNFDGTDDFLKASIPDSDALHLQASSWTVECWFNADALPGGNDVYLGGVRVDTSSNANNCWTLRIFNNVIEALWVNGSTQYKTVSPYAITASKWTHVAYVRDGNEQRLYQDGVLVVTTSHTTTPNLNNSSFLEIGGRTGSGFFNGQIQDFRIYNNLAKYTGDFIPAATKPDILPDTPSGVAYSSELKQITEGSVNGGVSNGDTLLVGNSSDFNFGSGDFTVELFAYHTSTAGNDTLVGMWNSGANRRTWMIDIEADQGRLRGYWSTDGSAVSNVQTATNYIARRRWNHIVFCRQGNTMRLYLNGNQEATATESSSLYNNVTDSLGILSATDVGNDPCNGHISNVRILKGTCLYPDGTSFTPPSAPLTNVTNTVLLACQSPTSATAYEVSPGAITTSGSVSASAFNPFNDDINTVRGQESLYCTLNPLEKNSKFTLSENNLKFTNGTNNWTGWIGGTQTFKTGKWYWEVRIDVSSQYHIFGIVNTTLGSISAADTYQYAMCYQSDGRFYAENNSTTQFSSGNRTAQTIGDICSIAVDMDNKKMWLGINGQWVGGANPSIGYLPNWDSTRGFTDGDTYMPVFMSYGSSGQTVNFGQKPFRFTPPDGFQPLCLNNLPRPTKAGVRPDEHFKTMVWSGDDTTRSMTGLGFRPDLVWVKCRTLGAFHNFTDSVRGPKVIIQSNTVTAEQKPTTHNGAIDSFDPDGFTLGTGLSYGDVNQSGRDYVGWAWKGGTPENYTAPCGSVLFDGTGDYLSLPVSSDFQFGSGDFTIECWAKAFDEGTDDILGILNTGSNRRTFCLRKDQTESVQFLYSANGSSAASVSSSAGAIKLGTWHHYAVVRDNLEYRIYLDGVSVATDSSSTDAIYTNNDDGLRIGSSYNTDFDGQISNVRIVKGTALYTSNFTPSSEPLTNVTNTVLLCCQSATSASAATVAPGSITANGNATPTTHNPFDNYRVDGRVYATAAEAGLTAGTKASLLTGASVNTDSGFGILTWTGDGDNSNLQIPHGLPSRPMMIAVKKRNEAVDDWYVAHDGLDGDNYAYRMFWGPNGTSTKSGSQAATNPYYLANQLYNNTIVLNNTTTYGGGNEDNIAYVAYCWSEVPGFSKFSTYEGTANGGADGPFIECGFKPAFVLIKADDVASSWYLFDGVRGSIQTQGSDAQVLFPDTAAVEDANGGQGIDFLSNGFKVRAANGYGINNQVTYVYAAFAEAPTTNLYGGQANAR